SGLPIYKEHEGFWRKHQLASRQDEAVTAAEGQVHPEDALRRGESNPEAALEYRRRFFSEADRYLHAIGPREIGRNVGSATQPGRIPEQYAHAIDVLLLAHDRTNGERATLYLAAAWNRAREAIAHFLPDDSPLPRCLDRQPLLADGSPFPSFYSSYLGGDDLMWSVWRLSLRGSANAARRTNGGPSTARCPPRRDGPSGTARASAGRRNICEACPSVSDSAEVAAGWAAPGKNRSAVLCRLVAVGTRLQGRAGRFLTRGQSPAHGLTH
ncbi:MAG: hypothetical protein OXN89_21970, partial [Bryobacterales bacterium]|nr:hypothetical protein [Bryobacterales bacterium]